MTPGRGHPDPEEARRLLGEIEAAVGTRGTLNRLEVCEAAGLPLDRATLLWRALGFPAAQSDEDRIFNEADVEALRLVGWLEDVGVMDREIQPSLVRSMGRSFSRLAEWEMSELVAAMAKGAVGGGGPDGPSDGSAGDSATGDLHGALTTLLPVLEDLQGYVWRRHLAGAAARLLLQPREDGSDEGRTLLVGFADIVGFTRRTREMTVAELDRLVETFEACSADIVTERDGQVIKTIGDEILFVVDDPLQGARIALELVEAEEHVEDFPTLHVGLAYGEVLTRVGDVYGPTVNLASRLASVARPGRVLVDRELGALLKPMEEEFRVRRARSTVVRGYTRLDTWTLKRPKPPRAEEERSGRKRRSSRRDAERAVASDSASASQINRGALAYDVTRLGRDLR
jgi:adenylate cyclase